MPRAFKHSFFTKFNPFNNHLLAAFDNGMVIDVDAEMHRLNNELDDLVAGGRDTSDVCEKIKKMAIVGHGVWEVLPSGKAWKAGAEGKGGGRGRKLPELPPTGRDRRAVPPEQAQERAILRNLTGGGREVAIPKRYPFSPPLNPHRGEYRRARAGARTNIELWQILYPEFQYRGKSEPKFHPPTPCPCGCGRLVIKGTLAVGCAWRITGQCDMAELLGMRANDLREGIREYYLARLEYPWLTPHEWFGKGIL